MRTHWMSGVTNVPSFDPATLVRAVRAGDVDALGTLYDAYGASLYRTALRLSGSREDAEDVIHDCFVGLPEALRHYDEHGKLEAWLRRIVVRLVLMRRRGDARRREVPIDATAEPRSSARSDAAAELDDVRRVVAALPPSLRDVFILRQIEGYSHSEVALVRSWCSSSPTRSGLPPSSRKCSASTM